MLTDEARVHANRLSSQWGSERTLLMDLRDAAQWIPLALADKIFAQAGASRSDVKLHDCFAVNEPTLFLCAARNYPALGLCAVGDAHRFVGREDNTV
ncbi:hypothetical protein EDB87DRAFT_1182581 [Lactarius vividus]|nr:hypothetical protein EDB87DRAFT_1182581 [Lactarius vividus]